MTTWTRVVVAMPAYNEHEGLATFLAEIERSLSPMCSEIVFVVVDDASVTPLQACLSTADIKSHVVVNRHPRNLGHGPSALHAYQAALDQLSDAVIHVDGDGQFDGTDFPRLLQSLRGNDVVLGVRSVRTDPWFRRALTRALRVLIDDPRIIDVNTPFRAFRPWALRELLIGTPTDSLVPHIHFSLQARALPHRLSVISVRHRDRLGGQVQGTSWGSRPRRVLPPRRLAVFCLRALVELYRARPGSGVAPSIAPLPVEP